MYIHKVLSYKKSWSVVSKDHLSEIDEALAALDEIYSSLGDPKSVLAKLNTREQWAFTMTSRGWDVREEESLMRGRPITLPRPVPTKNGLGASVPMGMADLASKWLFQDSAIAVKQGLIKLPIMFLPVRDFARSSETLRFSRVSFEGYAAQIERLAPLTYQYPFLIVGYSGRGSTSPLEINEVEVDLQTDSVGSAIDRCIEFPPEYHQAGLGILSYFGTYLREQYPDENASVKIEQHGLTVRLIVVANDGRSEVIEKALHEFELIMSGTEPPEKIAHSTNLILDLRNELRIAHVRLESQRDMLGMQNARVDQLMSLVGAALSQKNSVLIDFKPTITLKNDVVTDVNFDVVGLQETIKELLDELPRSNKAHIALEDLSESLVEVETITDKESVKRSPAMKKLKDIIEKVIDNGSEFNLAVKKAESGWEVFSDLAKKYNSVAEWCGLPVVPSALLK